MEHSPSKRGIVSQLWRILTPADRRKAVQIFFGMIVGMGLETLSVGAIVPALSVLAKPGEATVPEFVRRLLPQGGEHFVAWLLIGLLALFTIKTLILVALLWQQVRFIADLRRHTACRLFENYLLQPWSFHLQRNSSQLIRNATMEIHAFVQGASAVMLASAEICVVAGIVLLLLYLEPVGAMAVIGFLAIATWLLQSALGKRAKRWGKLRQESEGRRLKAIQQSLSGVREVKTFGREADFLDLFRRADYQACHAQRMQAFAFQLPRLWYEYLAVVGITLLCLIFWVQGMSPADLIPRLAVFGVAAFRLMPSLNRIMGSLQSIRFMAPAISVLDEELSRPCPPIASQTSRLPFHHNIAFDHVTFNYPDTQHPAIQDVAFTINRGDSVGIIGESGAGKSTLVDLLLGLLEQQSGAIAVDGRDIREDMRGWQNNIGYVPQTIYLIDDTIRANVAFGVPADQIDAAALDRALKAAQLTEFIDELPDGIDTVVGERGIRLSGGQRQRIGIARALYWNPPVLVLDEATSALDTATEAGVMAAVAMLHGEKTLIIITHRLSTISGCDYIFQLDQGSLAKVRGSRISS
jgi:ATP-binding cassette, subfamily B, bacterial PglK